MSSVSDTISGSAFRCPFCANPNSAVRDSRPVGGGEAVRRRRMCTVCGGRFTTFERVQLRELVVIKRSGRRVAFDQDKLARSINMAVAKRSIDPTLVAHAVSRLVRTLEPLGETEITSILIGEHVLPVLRALDDVAYVRYASVYCEFKGAGDFAGFLQREELI